MSDQKITIRRIVVQLQNGQSKSLEAEARQHSDLKDYAERFARSRKIAVEVTSEGSKLTIHHHGDLLSTARYGEMDGLKVGESHVFKVGIPEHAAVRRMASYRNRDGSGRLFKCSVVDGGMRVTRMPATVEERQAMAVVDEPRRASKWGLEQLEHTRELRFDIPRPDHQRLRLSAHQMAVKASWTIRCRIQDDGSMLVYRTDAGAPA
jgi:hypothetical protein